MTKPTPKVIHGHCARAGVTEKQAKAWAKFLHGLDWPIIKPLVHMAHSSHTHPALAAGMVARSTQDEAIRRTLVTHLESKGPAQQEGAPSQGGTHHRGATTPPPLAKASDKT